MSPKPSLVRSSGASGLALARPHRPEGGSDSDRDPKGTRPHTGSVAAGDRARAAGVATDEKKCGTRGCGAESRAGGRAVGGEGAFPQARGNRIPDALLRLEADEGEAVDRPADGATAHTRYYVPQPFSAGSWER